MNKTEASQPPDDHEEDDQEGPAHKKLWRTNVKPTALKIVAGLIKNTPVPQRNQHMLSWKGRPGTS